jgi:hypothetical protein
MVNPNWKTYQSEKFGFSFAYPSEWVVEEKESLVLDWGNRYLSRLGFSEGGFPRMTAVLLPKENTSDGASQNAFKDGYARFSYFHAANITDVSIDGYKTLVNFNGCYECYEVKNADQISSQITSLTCNVDDVCLQITLNSLRNTDADLKDFYLNNFLPTLHFAGNFNQIKYEYIKPKG